MKSWCSGGVGKTKAAEPTAWKRHVPVLSFLRKPVPRRGNDSKDFRTQVYREWQ